jgi:sulfatase maturation enzyme AslB (radical SAM superfamily)
VRSSSKKFENIFVTTTKLGKLQKETYKQFLDNVIQTYVKKDKFKLILDFWVGQINSSLYYKKRVENNEPTCSLEIIPLKYTPTCQPCDMYFYRQVKKLYFKVSEFPSFQSS